MQSTVNHFIDKEFSEDDKQELFALLASYKSAVSLVKDWTKAFFCKEYKIVISYCNKCNLRYLKCIQKYNTVYYLFSKNEFNYFADQNNPIFKLTCEELIIKNIIE